MPTYPTLMFERDHREYFLYYIVSMKMRKIYAEP
jgi:hypothetical protein